MLLRSFRPLLAGLLLGTAIVHPAAAQAPAALPTKIKVYLVGTFHFNSSPTDVNKGSYTDMTTPTKQRELDELVDKLQKTRADKVFVEWMPSRQRFVDSTYALYRNGQRPVGSRLANNNEVVQLGYRLADKLNRPRVYCADADGVFDYEAAQAYAKAHGQEAILESAFAQTLPADSGWPAHRRPPRGHPGRANCPGAKHLLLTALLALFEGMTYTCARRPKAI